MENNILGKEGKLTLSFIVILSVFLLLLIPSFLEVSAISDEIGEGITYNTHKECVDGECKDVLGSGRNTCKYDIQCTHKECVNGRCERVIGQRSDMCHYQSDCKDEDTLPPDDPVTPEPPTYYECTGDCYCDTFLGCNKGYERTSTNCKGGLFGIFAGTCCCKEGSTTPTEPICGNNIKESGEECDGTDVGDCKNGCDANCKCKEVNIPPPPSCSCGSWRSKGCGGGTCADDKMYQTRSCSPSGCNDEKRCVSSSSCESTIGPKCKELNLTFTKAYGSECGDDNYNPIADFCGKLGDPVKDGKVDFEDLMIFGTNYGNEKWCTEQLEKTFDPCEQVELICTDSDGGKDYYIKGEITGELVSGPDSPSADLCFEDGIELRELFCNDEGKGEPILYECPYGCEDGACIEEPTETMTIKGKYIILNENFPDDVYSSPIYFYTGVLPIGKIVRTLLDFDLTGLEDKEIKKAKLVIKNIAMLFEQDYGKQVIEVHKVTGPWDTTTACWNNPPSFDTTVVSSQEITKNGKYTFSITPIMQFLIEHEAGILLKAEDEETTNLKKFDEAYLKIWYTAEEEETKNCKEMGGNCRFLFGCRRGETEADYECPFWGKCCMPEEEEPEQLEGTILVKKDSSINQFAKELASKKNWNLLEVSTFDPKTIRNNIIQLYNKESFNFLLILGDETQIPIYDKELLRDYVISTGFEFNGEIIEKDENVLDSLYYGNLDDDLYIELAVGRLPFTNVNNLEKYYSNFPSKKSINKINVLSHLSFNIPHVGYLRPQLASYQETEYFMINTISEFNQHLIPSDLLYSNNHGTNRGFSIGEFYTLEHIPNLNNKQIIIGESCSAGAELGPEFVKKGAIAYIGYYVPAKLGGLAILDQPSNFKTIGEILKETNNFYYMRQLTNPGPRSTYYLIGDPSIEIEFDSYDKINIETKNNQLWVKVPAMHEYTFNKVGGEVTNIYSQYSYQFSSTSSTLNLLKENPPYETDNEILIKCDPQYETGFLVSCRDVSSEYPNSPYQYAGILAKTDQGHKDTYGKFVIRLDKNYNIGNLYESKEGQIEELDDYLIEIINAEGEYYLIIYEPNTIMFNNINNGDAYKERTFIVDII